jgi:uridine kinase
MSEHERVSLSVVLITRNEEDKIARCLRSVAWADEVVVVDGILVLAFPAIRECLDISVFVDAPAEVRLTRRLDRDVRERGRTPESVRAQFAATVAPMHEAFVSPCRTFADLVLDGQGDLSANLDLILDRLAAVAVTSGGPA